MNSLNLIDFIRSTGIHSVREHLFGTISNWFFGVQAKLLKAFEVNRYKCLTSM